MVARPLAVPRDAEPSDLWVKLCAIARPLSAVFEFEARHERVGKIVFRVLTAGELGTIRARADAATREVLGEDYKSASPIAYEEEYEQQRYYHLLALAARQAESPDFPAFPSPKAVREFLTDDEISVATVAYAQFRRESGPIKAETTPAEMEAWIEILRASKNRMLLASLSGEALIDMVLDLVARLPPPPAPEPSPDSP